MKIVNTLILLIFTNICHAQLTIVGGVNTYIYNPNVPAPILFAFHGNGEAGAAQNILKNGLPQLLSNGYKPPIPIYIVCPQDGYGTFDASRLPNFITKIKKIYPLADTSQIYVTGYSAGGVTAANAINYINIKASIPMSLAGYDQSTITKYAQTKTPIRLYVGDKDVTFRPITEWYATQLTTQEADVSLTYMLNTAHCCWNDIFKTTTFWQIIRPKQYVNLEDDITTTLSSVTLTAKTNITSAKPEWTVLTKAPYIFSPKNSLTTTLSVMVRQSYKVVCTISGVSDTVNVTFIQPPPPPQPIMLFSVEVSGVIYKMYQDGKVTRSSGRWSGATTKFMIITCETTNTVTIYNSGIWEQK